MRVPKKGSFAYELERVQAERLLGTRYFSFDDCHPDCDSTVTRSNSKEWERLAIAQGYSKNYIASFKRRLARI